MRRLEDCMTRHVLTVPALLIAAALGLPRVGAAQAFKVAKFNIGGTVDVEDNSPEGAASDGKGKIFVNNEGKNTIQVIDDKAMKVLASWPVAPCEGPTGIAYDRATNRIFAGCGKTSVVVDPASG